jgi:hypothetical protein
MNGQQNVKCSGKLLIQNGDVLKYIIYLQGIRCDLSINNARARAVPCPFVCHQYFHVHILKAAIS